MSRGKEWTPEMDAVLQSRYPEEGAEVIAEVLGTTPSSVRHRAMRLGVSYAYPGHGAHVARRFWTPERDQMVIDRYAAEGPNLLASELGKSRHAIVERARILRIQPRRVESRQPEKERRPSAVYALRHKSGRMYIGCSKDVAQRCLWHRSALRAGIHPAVRLQEAWLSDGESAFEFAILDVGVWTKEQRHAAEQAAVDAKKTRHPDFGFNTNNPVDEDAWKPSP